METELNAICKDILTLLDESLLTKAGPAELTLTLTLTLT